MLVMLGLLLGQTPEAAAQTLTPQQLEQLREQMRGQQGTSLEDEPRIRTDVTRDGGQPGPLLDRPVSRTEYRLGPGDRLTLSIFGYRNELFPLTVTPEGTIIIPTIGIVPVVGLNLEQATQRTRQRVQRLYPASEVEVSLAAIRSFRVFLVGDVPEPGIRTATAVTRVSELVPTQDENDVIYRNVIVRRGDQIIRVDLARFLRTGDVVDNPFLKDGDIIQIPTVNETVAVTGEVAYPGRYEYRAAETLHDLIRLANGESGRFLARAADTVFLMRFSENPRGDVRAIARSEAEGELGRSLRIEPFDALFVPRLANYLDRTTARIEGEVVKPGEYPLRPNVTTVRQLVEMAGGFSADASPSETVLRRASSRPDSASSVPLAAVPPELLSRSERQIMQVMSRSDEQNIVIDISPASPAFDLPLQTGDVLVVPKRRREVVVLGAVRRPGLVVYTPGQPIEHFVEAVGGYTRQANVGDVQVLRSETGARLQRRDIDSIQPGDRIVVPFRERTTFLERVQTTQGVINTVSGLVLTIVGLQRLWEAVTN